MATLTINRGTTYTIEFQYQKDGVDTTLVGATVRYTMKEEKWDTDTDDSEALVTKNVTNGNSSSEATITLDPSDTATITPGKYFYDIKVEEAGGDIYKVDEGKVTLDGSPTNRLS